MRTKQQELDILRRWQVEAREEPGSYLAALLSDHLLEYVSGKLCHDEPPDIWEELECASARERTFRQRLMTHDAGMDDLHTKLMLAQTEINCLKIKLWDAHGARLLAEYLK